jgi:hypothetical protein
MKLPFTTEQFLGVFTDYNETIFPLQILLYVFAGAIIYFVVRKRKGGNKRVNLILTFLWLWMGIIYHIVFFSPINKAAYGFGALFIVQAGLIFYFGVIRHKLTYRFRSNTLGRTGLGLMLFALVFYPLIGYMLGHIYPAAPTFGAPCPTAIFTFGLFLWSDKTFPKIVLIIPFTWSVIGFSAAITLGMTEDISPLIAGVMVTAALVLRKKTQRVPSLDTSSSYSRTV